MHRRDFVRRASAALVAAPLLGSGKTSLAVPPCRGRVTDADLDAFGASLDGTLVLPTDAAYANARLAYARRHSAAPLAVVRASSVEDVVATVRFARERSLSLVPRSGGHSYVGASVGNGIVLDVAAIQSITYPADDRVRIGAGAKLGAVYSRLHCDRGLALPSGTCGSVGIAGVTLGGGYGIESRGDGLTADRLRRATVVLADGSVAVAEAASHPRLFWALRGGGGGAFGVVTDLDFEPVPSRPRWRAQVTYAWPDAEAAFLAWEQFVAGGPDPAIGSISVVSTNPSWTTPRFRAQFYSSEGADHARAVAESTVPEGVRPMNIATISIAAPACPATVPVDAAWGKQKSCMVHKPVGAEGFAPVRSWFDARWNDPSIPRGETAQLLFDAYGGAIADVAADATAFVHRNAIYSAQFITWWSASTPPSTVERHLAWIRGLYDDARPRFGPGCYANYCDEDLLDWPTAYWGANLPALQKVKATYDPDGFFRGKHTVPPSGTA